MSNIRCPICGEEYSDTYKSCPFCEEDAAAVRGRTIRRRSGRRASEKKRNAGAGGVLMLFSVVVILAVVCFFAFKDDVRDLIGYRPEPVQTDGDPSGGSLPTVNDGSGSGSGQPDPGPQTPPEGDISGEAPPVPSGPLTLEETDITIPAGETGRLTFTGGNGTIVWTSSNDQIATVADGAVTGVAGGTVTITGVSGEDTVTCSVTVTGDPWVNPVKLKLNKTDVTLPTSSPSFTLTVKGSDTVPTYTPDKEGIVSIKEDGTITRIGRGTVIVTVTCDGQSMECIVRCRG